ncbi:MAG: twin-arginine translocase TatA/TatE family subunit [Bacteroidaceae bacterium]|nr:twin-arginine translocase TatA/TatE family subunit [Bacteroidaceae bacterium]
MENLILFGMPTGSEWIIILVIVLFLFGGKKIPELMKGLGKGVKMFKDGVNEAKSEIDDAAKELEKKDEEEKK